MKNLSHIKYKGNYIYAKRYGSCEYDESLEFWARVVEACKKHRCRNILCESFITGVSTFQGVRYSKIFPEAGMTPRHRLAYVYRVPDAEADIRFVETYLINRGLLNGRVFNNISEGQNWLLYGEAGKDNFSCTFTFEDTAAA